MLAEDSVSCIFNSAQNPFSARLGSSLLLFRLRWNFLWSLGVFHARIWHGLPGRLLTRHSAANNDSIITSSSQFAELYGLVPAVPSPYAILFARPNIVSRHPARLASSRQSDGG